MNTQTCTVLISQSYFDYFTDVKKVLPWLQENLHFDVECNPNYSPLQVNVSCLNNLQTKNVIDDRLILLNASNAMSISCLVEHVLGHLIPILHSFADQNGAVIRQNNLDP